MTQVERTVFRLLRMNCCGAMICWVNPRFPNYCPECGKLVFPDVKQWVMQKNDAEIRHEV